MSRHWRPNGDARWLNPQAYDALSVAEKRALWRERQAARLRRPGRRLSRRGDFGFARLVVLVAGFGAAAAWHYTPGTVATAASASGASAVRAQFGFCHSGG